MKDDLDSYFQHAQGIRRTFKFRQTIDQNGNVVTEPILTESIGLSQHGSIDQVHFDFTHAAHFSCGHPEADAPGGKCCEPECGRLSCLSCYSRCERCRKGLCLIHRYTFTNGETCLPVCKACQGALTRMRLKNTVVRALISPFVRFDTKA